MFSIQCDIELKFKTYIRRRFISFSGTLTFQIMLLQAIQVTCGLRDNSLAKLCLAAPYNFTSQLGKYPLNETPHNSGTLVISSPTTRTDKSHLPAGRTIINLFPSFTLGLTEDTFMNTQ